MRETSMMAKSVASAAICMWMDPDYCGEFKKSHQEGRGVPEIPRQQIAYDCEFKHDEPVYGEYSSPGFNGFGCLLVKVSWPNGDRWRGEFANDAPKQGVMTFAHNKATLNLCQIISDG